MLHAQDQDGDNVTWSILTNDGPFELTNDSVTLYNELNLTGPLDFEQQAEYIVEIALYDSAGANSSTNITVTVTDVNEAPLSVGSESAVVSEHLPVGAVVDGGLVATDPDADGNLTWAVLGGAGSVFGFTGGANASVSGAATSLYLLERLDWETRSEYIFNVSVTDSGGLRALVEYNVTLIDVPEQPELQSGVSSLSLPEDAALGVIAGSGLNFTDEDSSVLTWYVSGVLGAEGVFGVEAANETTAGTGGVKRLELLQALDFESVPEWVVSVNVSADGQWVVHNVTVTVTDVNEAPVSVGSESAVVSEHLPVGAVVDGGLVATDPDADGNLTWAVLGDAGSVFGFTGGANASVSGAATSLYLLERLDWETRSEYIFNVSVTDSGGLRALVEYNVTLIDVPEQPELQSGVSSLSLPEDAALGVIAGSGLNFTDEDSSVLTWYVSGVLGAEGVFGVEAANETTAGTGGVKRLELLQALDFESVPEWVVSVNVSADGQWVVHNVTVTVTDVNEAPVSVGSESAVVSEHLPVGAVVDGGLVATDPDADGNLTWAVLGGAGSVFGFTGGANASVSGAATSLYLLERLDWETRSEYIFNVSVTDSGGLRALIEYNVTLIDVPEQPELQSGVSSLSLPEDAALGVIAGSGLNFTDEDSSVLTWYVSGVLGAEGVFGVEAANETTAGTGGVKRLELLQALDFESVPEWVVSVNVSADGQWVVHNVTVTVTDVNEAPVSVGSESAVVSEHLPVGAVVDGGLVATDPDADGNLTWAVLGDAGSVFGFTGGANASVSGAATSLYLLERLDWETRSEYIFNVSVTDSGGLRALVEYNVTLIDVPEQPELQSGVSSLSLPEDAALGVIAGSGLNFTDEDSSVLTWYVSGVLGAEGVFGVEAANETTAGTGGVKRLELLQALDFESVPEWVVSVNVSADGQWVVHNVTVTVTDVNEAPVSVGSESAVVSEHLPVGAVVDGGLVATDPDADGNLTWAVLGGAGSVFGFTGGANASVSGAATSLYLLERLDWETRSEYIFNVSVTDSGGLRALVEYNVTLIDVPEQPELQSGVSSLSLPEDAALGVIAGSGLNFTDEDSSVLTWYVSGVLGAEGVFGVEAANETTAGTGGVKRLELLQALDFESVPEWVVSVNVSADGQWVVHNVTVTVTDVNEAPVSVGSESAVVSEHLPVGAVVDGGLSVFDVDYHQVLSWEIVGGSAVFSLDKDVTRSNETVSLLLNQTLNFESQREFSLLIRVADNGTSSLQTEFTFNVSVSDVDELPVLLTLGPYEVFENASVGPCFRPLLYAVDPDLLNSSISFSQARQFPSGGPLSVANTTSPPGFGCLSLLSPLDFEAAEEHVSEVVACDKSGGAGSICVQHNVTVTVLDVDEPPTAFTPTGTVSVAEDAVDAAVITTLTSVDPEGTDQQFVLLSGGNGTVTLVDTGPATAELRVVTGLDFEVQSLYQLVIAVTDGAGSGAFTTVSHLNVSVSDVNEPPLPVVRDLYVDENEPVGTLIDTLTAFEPEGEVVTWDLRNNLDHASFSLSAGGALTSDDVFNFEAQSQYSIRVRATDASSNHDGNRRYEVYIRDVQEAPSASNASFSVDEDTAFGALVHTLAFSDPENGTAAQSITIRSGNDEGFFAVDNSGAVTLARFPLNFEEVDQYTLVLRVTDPTGRFDEATLSIAIGDVNEAPFISVGQQRNVSEHAYNGADVGIPVEGWDWDNDTVTWSFATPSSVFAIDSATGQLSVADNATLNFETQASYSLSVRISDGSLDFTRPVMVMVQDANDPPVLPDGVLLLDENSADGTVVTSVSGNSPLAATDEDSPGTGWSTPLVYQLHGGQDGGGRFEVTAGGDVRVAVGGGGNARLNFEQQREFYILATATDAGGEVSAFANISIALVDVNEAPVVLDQAVSIAEDAAPAAATAPALQFADVDAGDTHTCSIIPPRTDEDPLDPGSFLFAVDPSPPCVVERAAQFKLDHEHEGGVFNLTLQVEDSGSLLDTSTITVTVTDVPEPPRFVDRNGQFDARFPNAAYDDWGSVVELAPAGTEVFQLRAFDEDAGQNSSIVFSLDAFSPGVSNSYFTIDPSTGSITTTPQGHFFLSFEDGIIYNLTVRAEDSAGLFTLGVVHVPVTDTAEAPVFVNTTLYVFENAPVGWQLRDSALPTGPVGAGTDLQFQDSDFGSMVTFAIVDGNEAGQFSLTPSTERLQVGVSSVDFETLAAYLFTMRVQDQTGLTGFGTVAIQVVDVDDDPVITSATSATVAEMLPAGTTLYEGNFTDIDGDVSGTWSELSGDPGNQFTVLPDGRIQLTRELNYEVDAKVTTLQVQFTNANAAGKPNPWSAGSDTIAIAISLQDMNDAPVVGDVVFSLDENTPALTSVGFVPASDEDLALTDQALTWSIIGGDADSLARFTIDAATGELFVAHNVSQWPGALQSLDFEHKAVHNLVVQVQDNGTSPAALLDTASVTINLQDVNEPPVLDLSTLFVAENAPPGARFSYNRHEWKTWGEEYALYGSNFYIRDVLGNPDMSLGATLQANASGRMPAGNAVPSFDPDAAVQTTQFRLYLLNGTGFTHSPRAQYVNRAGYEVVLAQDMTETTYPAPLGGCCVPQPELARGFVPATSNDTLTLPDGLVSQAPIPASAFSWNGNTLSIRNGTVNHEATPRVQFLVHAWDDGTGFGGVRADAYYLFNVEVVDVNEAAALRLRTPAQPSMDEAAALNTIIADVFVQVLDEDNQDLHVAVRFEGSPVQYFNSTPFVSSRDENGTRLAAQIEVVQPFLPSVDRPVFVQIIDPHDPRKSSRESNFFLRVADVNDPPQFPTLPERSVTVPENSPKGTVVATLEAIDKDKYQNLEYEVVGRMAPYFRMEPRPELLLSRYPDPPANDTLSQAVPAQVRTRFVQFGNQITRRADLVVNQDSLDYESLQQLGGIFTIEVLVRDEYYVSGENGFEEPGPDDPLPETDTIKIGIVVQDVPDVPVITGVSTISPFGLTTAGGEEVTMTGYNLGSVDEPHPDVTRVHQAHYYSNATGALLEARGCRVTQMYTEIKCSTSEGFGAGYSWQLALGGFVPRDNQVSQLSNWSNDTLTYAAPNLVEFEGPGADSASTSGLQTVRIKGSQFGTAVENRIDSITYGPRGSEYVATNCSVVQDHRTIECTTAEGVGRGLRWIVVIAGLSSQTPTTNYAEPSIQDAWIERADGTVSPFARTAGGDTLVLAGNDFGSALEFPGQIDLVQYGLPLYSLPGVDEPAIPTNQDCSQQSPAITPASVLNPSLDMVLTAVSCRVASNHSEVRCRMAPGQGADLFPQITIRAQRSAVANVSISYAPPSIASIRAIGSTLQTASTAGTTEMVLRGTDFGRTAALVNVVFGQVRYFENGTARVPPLERYIEVSTGSHTQRSFVVPQGHGVGIPTRVEVQCQRSNTVYTVGYRAPTISSLAHLGGGLANPPIRMRISGNNFGQCCYAQRVALQRLAANASYQLQPAERAAMSCQCMANSTERVTVTETGGFRQAECFITHYTDAAIDCHLEFTTVMSGNETQTDTILDGTVAVTAGGQTSPGARYLYSNLLSQPVIAAATPSTASTRGGEIISLTGSNFGTLREQIKLLYRRPNGDAYEVPIQPNALLLWTPTRVNFTMPPGQGAPVIELSFSGTTQRALFERFEYAPAHIDNVNSASGFTNGFVHSNFPNNPNTLGGSRRLQGVGVDAPLLEILGDNFGRSALLPPPLVVAPGVTLSLNGLSASGAALQGGLVAGPPFTSDGVPQVDPAVRQENFVLVGGKQCPIVTWSSTRIQCRPPAGFGASNDISVHIYTGRTQTVQDDMWRRTVAPDPYTYTPPAVSGLDFVQEANNIRNYPAPAGRHGPTTGGALVELRGSSFGTSGTPLTITVAGTPVPDANVELHTHSSIRFRTPEGQGRNLPLVVSVGGQTVESRVFSYDPPVVLAVQETTSVAVAAADKINSNFSSSAFGQLRLNAKGSSLAIIGRNFGNELLQPAVTVGGFPCSYRLHSQSRIECSVSDITVGPKALTVTAAGQDTTLPPQVSDIFAECRTGEFGVVHGVDRCFACPTCFEAACDILDPEENPASQCEGGTAPPVAARGFWRLQRSQLQAGNNLIGQGSGDLSEYAAAKQAEFYEELAANLNGTDAAGSQFEYIFTRCEPPQGCIGNNLCAEGYSGPACSICVAGTHQRDLITGGCTPCPDAPELYMVGMLVGVIIFGAILYKLYKKGPSVAALGIAVDYFQVLSVFGTLSLQWPESVVFVFRIASASAASVEVTSPECSVSLTYNQKWYFQMAIPLVAIVAMAFAHCFIVVKKYLKYRNKNVDNVSYTKHLPAMIGFLFMMLSFLYISLCGKAFEVLRCTSVGGRPVLVVDTEVACEGSDYERISWWARIGIFSYGIGIPALFGLILLKSSQKMKVDQALRLRNLSGSRDTNPYYDMQKRFKRLYFKFKPEYYYWLLVLLARKFLIVLLSALLYTKPMLAATSSVLILFLAYSLQLNFKPYRGHQEQSKEEAVASGQLSDEIPKAVLDKLRKDMAAEIAQQNGTAAPGGAERMSPTSGARNRSDTSTGSGGSPSRRASFGAAASPPKLSTPKARRASLSPAAGVLAAPQSPATKAVKGGVSTSNPLMLGSPAAAGGGRVQNPKSFVHIYKKGVDLKAMNKDRSLIMANDPSFVTASSVRSAPAAGSRRFAAQPSMRFRSGSSTRFAGGSSTRSLAGKGAKGSSAPASAAPRRCFGLCPAKDPNPKTRCCGLCPAKGASVAGLGLREEARKGGKTKIKAKFLYDYNLLETTFLFCGILVLLAGVMFKSADATGEVPAGSGEALVLEILVITIVIGSTIVCVSTVLAELLLGFKYFMWASELRRRREKEEKRRAILEGRKVQLSKDQKALLVWSKIVYTCPRGVRRRCGKCCNVPAPAIITGAAYKATIMKVAKGNTKETAAIKSSPKRNKAASPRAAGRRGRASTMFRRNKTKRQSLGDTSDSSESESDTERQRREDAQKLANNARNIIQAAKPQGKRVQGLGVVENATPREFAHLASQDSTSIHDSSVRREAVLARLRAATRSKGRLPAGVVAPTSAHTGQSDVRSKAAQAIMEDAATSAGSNSELAHQAAQRAAATEAALAKELGIKASVVTRAVNSATAAGILRSDGDDFLMSAAKKARRPAVARYMVSIHLGRITRLADKRINTGQPLRITVKTGNQSEKLNFAYAPLQPMRQRELKLLIFDPTEDTVHCTLYADFKREGNVAQHESVLGHLHFRTSELPDPAKNERSEREFLLKQYDGKVSGALTLLLRLQHRGAAVDDWVELGMGSPDAAVPELQSRGLLRRRAGPAKGFALQGSDSLSYRMEAAGGNALPTSETQRKRAGSVFVSANPLQRAAEKRGSGSSGSEADSKSAPKRRGKRGSVTDSDESTQAAMLAAASGGAFTHTPRGKQAAAATAAAAAAGGGDGDAAHAIRTAAAIKAKRPSGVSLGNGDMDTGAESATGGTSSEPFAMANPLGVASRAAASRTGSASGGSGST